MKNNKSYLTIGVAAGLLTATVAGLSVASYMRSRKRTPEEITAADEKYKAKHTTRHGSHLTKTTVGISDIDTDLP